MGQQQLQKQHFRELEFQLQKNQALEKNDEFQKLSPIAFPYDDENQYHLQFFSNSFPYNPDVNCGYTRFHLWKSPPRSELFRVQNYLVVNGSKAMILARLMAVANFR